MNNDLQQTALMMLHELETTRLIVTLIPSMIPEIADRGGMIRVVDSHNPQWYRDFCAAFPSQRSKPRRRSKPDTRIKRAATITALKNISEGKTDSTYAKNLIPYIESYSAKIDAMIASYNQESGNSIVTHSNFTAFFLYV